MCNSITSAVTHGVKYSIESLDFTPVIIVIKHLGYAFSVPTPTPTLNSRMALIKAISINCGDSVIRMSVGR